MAFLIIYKGKSIFKQIKGGWFRNNGEAENDNYIWKVS